MSAEVKSEWITALRSGDYEQGHRSLRQRKLSPNGEGYTYTYCCLGVLCDLMAKRGRGHWNTSQAHDVFVVPAPEDWTLEDYEALGLGISERQTQTVHDAMHVPFPLAKDLSLLPPGTNPHNVSADREVQSTLANMNDGISGDGQEVHSSSFEKIATWIRENL